MAEIPQFNIKLTSFKLNKMTDKIILSIKTKNLDSKECQRYPCYLLNEQGIIHVDLNKMIKQTILTRTNHFFQPTSITILSEQSVNRGSLTCFIKTCY